MSIYRTYKSLEKRGRINGKNYELIAYTTYYYPYSRLEVGKFKYAEREEAKDLELTFKRGTKYGSNGFTDNYGNEWHTLNETLYVGYVDGLAMNVEPISYYDVCQLISKDANLVNPEMISGYDYCYNKLTKCQSSDFEPIINGEYIRDYDKMFSTDFKIGDMVFYVSQKDRDTRCGERKQIEKMIIKDIAFGGDGIYLYNFSHLQGYVTRGDVYGHQRYFAKSVEELCEKYPNEKLYMWHRNGRIAIEECHSTELYLRYNS